MKIINNVLIDDWMYKQSMPRWWYRLRRERHKSLRERRHWGGRSNRNNHNININNNPHTNPKRSNIDIHIYSFNKHICLYLFISNERKGEKREREREREDGGPIDNKKTSINVRYTFFSLLSFIEGGRRGGGRTREREVGINNRRWLIIGWANGCLRRYERKHNRRQHQRYRRLSSTGRNEWLTAFHFRLVFFPSLAKNAEYWLASFITWISNVISVGISIGCPSFEFDSDNERSRFDQYFSYIIFCSLLCIKSIWFIDPMANERCFKVEPISFEIQLCGHHQNCIDKHFFVYSSNI